jgi:hypothetical protein
VTGRLAYVTHDKDHWLHAVVARRAAEPFTADSILVAVLASHWKSSQDWFPVDGVKVCSPCFLVVLGIESSCEDATTLAHFLHACDCSKHTP